MTFLIQPLALSSLLVTGDDRNSWLDSLLTAEVKELPSGRAIPALFLTKQGKIQAEVLVLSSSRGTEVAHTENEGLIEELDRYLVMEDAELAPGGAHFFALLGSVPDQLAAEVSGLCFEYVPLGPEGRLLWTLVDEARVLEVAAALGGVKDEVAFDSARVQVGWARAGVDFGPEDNPQEAGLEGSHVSFKKGCYLGQEVVCMQEMRGKVKRRVARLEASGPLSVGQVILNAEGQEIGKVTSASGSRGLARIKAPAYAAGTEVRVGEVSARVSPLQLGVPWDKATSPGILNA